MRGTVIQSTGSFYDVLINGGEIISCRIKGKFRLDDKKQTNPIAVGDEVEVVNDEKISYVIDTIYPRKNYIVRTDPHKKEFKHIIASNIDQTVVIASMILPGTSYGFIDRILLTSEVYGIPGVVVFNKHDLYRERENNYLMEFLVAYNDAGYYAFSTSVVLGENIDQFKNILKGKNSLLIGHSGVGKSSLVNAIEPQLQLRVKEVSKYSEKGQHTTTFARMHPLSFGGAIVDTPGIKEFGLLDISEYEVGHYFPEIRALMNDCRFNNCLHINEKDCAVLAALEAGTLATTRYMSYVNFYEEIKSGKKW